MSKHNNVYFGLSQRGREFAIKHLRALIENAKQVDSDTPYDDEEDHEEDELDIGESLMDEKDVVVLVAENGEIEARIAELECALREADATRINLHLHIKELEGKHKHELENATRRYREVQDALRKTQSYADSMRDSISRLERERELLLEHLRYYREGGLETLVDAEQFQELERQYDEATFRITQLSSEVKELKQQQAEAQRAAKAKLDKAIKDNFDSLVSLPLTPDQAEGAISLIRESLLRLVAELFDPYHIPC